MQELIGNMTAEQFTQFIGVLLGSIILVFGSWIIVIALGHAIIDGWLFRKGALYYGSLRYLNKWFNKLEIASTHFELDIVNNELRSAIILLRYQRVIPKIIFYRLLDKCDDIYLQRYSYLD